jgi:chromosome segregation ATPase
MSVKMEEVQKSIDNICSIEKVSRKRVQSINKELKRIKAELDFKEKELMGVNERIAKLVRKKEEIEQNLEQEKERLFPKRSILIFSIIPLSISSEFKNSFLRSFKYSNNSFAQLSYPNELWEREQASFTNIKEKIVAAYVIKHYAFVILYLMNHP